MDIVILLNLITAWALAGLIWTIQLVHYPSFHLIDPARFEEFCSFHQRRITYIVAPLMLTELWVSVLLILRGLDFYTLSNFLIVGLLWICTVFLSMPLHKKLDSGFSIEVIHQLVATNWPRTFLWTVRGVLAVLIIWNT